MIKMGIGMWMIGPMYKIKNPKIQYNKADGKNTNPSSQRHDEKLLRVNFANDDATPVQGEDMINISFDSRTGVKAIVTI